MTTLPTLAIEYRGNVGQSFFHRNTTQMDIMNRHSSEKALPYLPRVVFWGRIEIYTAKPGAAEDRLMTQMALKKIILALVEEAAEAAAVGKDASAFMIRTAISVSLTPTANRAIAGATHPS